MIQIGYTAKMFVSVGQWAIVQKQINWGLERISSINTICLFLKDILYIIFSILVSTDWEQKGICLLFAPPSMQRTRRLGEGKHYSLIFNQRYCFKIIGSFEETLELNVPRNISLFFEDSHKDFSENVVTWIIFFCNRPREQKRHISSHKHENNCIHLCNE